MGKWYGKVGYAITKETSPGVWVPEIVESEYYGDVDRVYRRLVNSGGVNDDIRVSNEISFIADPFAYQNFHALKYIEFMGSLWKAENVTVEPPRLKLTIGGLYNGKTN